MYSKALLVVATIAVATAQHNIGYNHGHGHAVSSQNVVLHQSHGHIQHTPVLAHAPVIAHHAPIITHQAPVVSHAPVIAHAPIVHHQPAHYASHGHNVDYHAPAHYAFEYNVNDPHTGDIKSQQETREGNAVHGSYSLHEADGTVRRVEYTADAHSGFNAVVHREGHAAHAVPVHQPSHHSYH